MPHHRCVRTALVLVAATLAPGISLATDLDVSFASLPSAQGWAFGTGGSPLATEAGTFALAGGVLTLNTMAFGVTGAGTSAYYARAGVVNTFEPIVVTMRARLLEHEGDFTNGFVGNGLCFGFAHGTSQWLMGITPTQVRNVNGVVLSSAYDNTQFHDYRLEWSPPSTVRYYVDGALVSSVAGSFAIAANRVIFGDGTGAANAKAEITRFRFLQGAATESATTTWGRLKSLVH